MPPYTIENTPTRRKLSQAAVPAISTCGGIAGSGFYHFPPALNGPNGPVCFKRTRIIRDPQQGAYCICMCLRYSTWLDWKVIEWEHQYIKVNNALSTAIFRLRYLRLQIRKGQVTKNEQFGLYGSVGKIENTKDEWQNQGANLSSVVCILGQSLQYVGDGLFQKIQNCYKSLGVPSFDQVNCEANIPANQGAFKFASALTYTMNVFKNSPHLDSDSSLYALGWWFQADKRTGQIKRDASKRCTGGKLIFPNEHFWIDLSKCHGLIQLVWASSTFIHYTDPAQDNKSTTLVGMSAQCSSRLAKTMWPKAMAILRLAREWAIKSGMVIQSHPI
ncbi:hypothetical protein O181_091998 [Austropuccinia psidii MF-1]|uniref:Tet-like 2OG-Fe(II) oxygenase domain-containing protein n=1 Tax=Austropuccinia psidii MF-1 TaxID=1389203 RepID=A0A9Q3IYF1_9BASI|nr:hypothetical protein [Austropuccinia psidii MF-1]